MKSVSFKKGAYSAQIVANGNSIDLGLSNDAIDKIINDYLVLNPESCSFSFELDTGDYSVFNIMLASPNVEDKEWEDNMPNIEDENIINQFALLKNYLVFGDNVFELQVTSTSLTILDPNAYLPNLKYSTGANYSKDESAMSSVLYSDGKYILSRASSAESYSMKIGSKFCFKK